MQTGTFQSLGEALEGNIKAALLYLDGKLTATKATTPSHQTVAVAGWHEPEAIEAIAWYMVGQRALAIKVALRIEAQVEDTAEDQAEIRKSVEQIVGSEANPLSDQQKTDERNPWMAEALWHLCLFLSKTNEAFRAAGEVVALEEIHIGAKDHGPDVVALHREGSGFGVSIVETKAYKQNPNKAINDATEYFRAVDRGDHDLRLRQAVAHMRDALPAEVQNLISKSLWKANRFYIPNPHYDASEMMDWSNLRPSFKTLKVGAGRITIMPNALPGFNAFFEGVGDRMRAIVKTMNYV
ncbi:MAG: hypothetical protein EPO40_18840 [Myxococcaceae bacterium]|nr:MAG: hypothetical protein EPO40_18840 [Myxococcaceae bacterium]